MSGGIDTQFVREHYQKLTDAELVQAVTTDAAGLTSEAIEIVKEEIAKRNLSTSLIKGMEAQNRSFTIEEIDHYCNLIRQLDCPACGSSQTALNGTMTSEVTSFVFFTQHTKKIKIACPNCLDKANSAALTKTALLGWWGVPWGIIRSIKAISQNIKSKRSNHNNTPNHFLRSYTLSKIGELETYKDNKEKLQQLILVD
jgi:predicted nucleic-acid-binding Zn-ribbon protein